MSAAAVLGREFDSAVVASALAMDPVEVEERLDALDRVERLRALDRRARPPGWRPDAGVQLRSHSLPECAACCADPDSKSVPQPDLAETVLTLHGDKSAEMAAQLALLFEAGRDFARASDFFLLASQNAARMYAAEQAIALARQAVTRTRTGSTAGTDGRACWRPLCSQRLQHQYLTRPVRRSPTSCWRSARRRRSAIRWPRSMRFSARRSSVFWRSACPK